MVEMPPNVLRLGREIRWCRLCPRRCGVNRQAGQIGARRIGSQAVVASDSPHFGEEPCLVGSGGSGTIFFAGCNLTCLFCQNYDISQTAEGLPRTPRQIADIALALQGRGCININFVTPTHVVHAVAEAIVLGRYTQPLASPRANLKSNFLSVTGGPTGCQDHTPAMGVWQNMHWPASRFLRVTENTSRRMTTLPHFGQKVSCTSGRPGTLPT